MVKKVPGLYVIADLTAAKAYVGSSVDLQRRLYNHNRHLELNQHTNWQLQKAHNKGYDLVCLPIPVVDGVSSLELEQVVLDEFFPQGVLYNIAASATAPTLGRTFGPETRLKVALASKGRVFSEETRRKMSESAIGKNLGKVRSDEHKAAISAAHKGFPLSEDHKAKLSAHFKGRPLSPEHVQKNIDKSRLEQIPVVCGGTLYPGIREAARILDIPRSTIKGRFVSDNFDDWHPATPPLIKGNSHG